MIRNYFKVHKHQKTIVTVNCKDLTIENRNLNVMYSNEINEMSFFLHFDISRQNTGLEEPLQKFIWFNFSVLALVTSSLDFILSTWQDLYPPSKDNITGYGVLRNWLSICMNDISMERLWRSKLCSRLICISLIQAKSNSYRNESMINRNWRDRRVPKKKVHSSITCGYELIKEIPTYGIQIDIFSLYSAGLTWLWSYNLFSAACGTLDFLTSLKIW